MTFDPKRRKEDKYPGRVWGFFQRFFLVIGIATTFSVIMLSLTLSKMLSYSPPSLPDKILLTYTFESALAEVTAKPALSQPLLRPASTLHEVTNALRTAAKDPRVKGFVARIEALSFSTAQVQEVRDAVRDFRASGKFAYVYSESYGDFASGMSDYYLATAFEQIWMQPVGAVAITGLVMQVPFLKGALDKLGVAPEFAHRGIYKSASESLTETGMSGPHREMMTSLVGDLSGQIVAGIAQGRSLSEADVRGLIDGAPYNDRAALEKKLVDRLGYVDQLLDEAKAKVSGPGTEPVDLLGYDFVSETRDFKKGVGGFVSKFLRKDAPPSALKNKAQIALIFGAGEVVPSGAKKGFSEGGMSADKVTNAFKAALKDEDIAAIVFRIDSPGGSPTASETIRRVILQAREKGKPVVVSMGSTAASGGYWIASAADEIVAQPATLTGSIGVFGGKFVVDELIGKLGVSVETLQAGQDASMWSALERFTPAQKAKYEGQLQDIYDAFVTRVAEGRKLTKAQVESVAQGRVFTGRQAHDNKLVDLLGGLDTAVEEAKKLAKLEGDVPVVRYPPRKSTLELFISLATEGAWMMPDFKIGLAEMLQAAAPRAEVLKAPLPEIR